MKGQTIAITGKGGSGKTMACAIMSGLVTQRPGVRLLAIDADSAVNLPYALGIQVPKTVADIRRQIIEDPRERAKIEEKHIREVMGAILGEKNGLNLLVMGRPEGPGCFCSVNELLKYGIEGLSQQFDLTLIDCEAGPEQINRRVLGEVGVLIVLCDPTERGVRVAESIVEVVRRDESKQPKRMLLVVNRSLAEEDNVAEAAHRLGIELAGRIPVDPNITQYDRSGRPLVQLPRTSPAVEALSRLLDQVWP